MDDTYKPFPGPDVLVCWICWLCCSVTPSEILNWKFFAILVDLCPAAQNLIIAKYSRTELPLTLKISSKSIDNILSYPVHKRRNK